MLELHRHIDQVRDIAISIALSEMVLVALFSLVFGSFLTRQLLALTTGAERLSAGELGYQLEVKGRDELAQTAVAFNAMSHDLLADRHKRNAIMVASLDPIITTDKDGHILECNAATERVFGLAERELINRSLVETLILEEHRTHYLNLLHGLAAPRDISLSAQRFEVRCQRGDGSPFTAELSVGSSEFDSEVYLVHYFQDITRRLKASAEREALERRNHMILEAAGEGVFGLDSEGRHTFVNPRAAELLGFEAEELIGKRSHETWHYRHEDGSDYPDHDCPIYSVLHSGVMRQGIEYFVRKDGTMIPVDYVATPLLDRGHANGAVVTFNDISDRLAAEEYQRQATTVFESTNDGIIVTDAEGKIVAINQAFSDITGYQTEEVLGETPNLLSSGRHDDRFFEQMWQELEKDGRWRGEIWNRRKSGEVYLEWLTISSVRNEKGQTTNYVATFSDISELHKIREELDNQANHDALTGLPNRRLFNDRLTTAIHHARRNGSKLAILFLDLDRFKMVNDSLGHLFGDRLLQKVVDRLVTLVRAEDTVARLGGDEFIVLSGDLNKLDAIANIAAKLLDSFKPPFLLDEHEIHLGCSIGIALFPEDGNDGDQLIRAADTAMYRAKERGRNNYQYFSEEMATTAYDRLLMESALHSAIEQKELVVYYQPKINALTGKIVGAEALVRWVHPTLGFIPPIQFIPLAEESDLINQVGEFVLRTACSDAEMWRQSGYPLNNVAVNISVQQFVKQDLVSLVSTVLKECGMPAEMLELEITESALMRETERSLAMLVRLTELGAKIAIDDFGTGYSSLSYLKKLPIHKLKIDQSFVAGLPEDRDDISISRAVIALGKSLGLSIVAEGVETESQAEFLAKESCDELQGYLFSKPVPAEIFVQLLQESAQD